MIPCPFCGHDIEQHYSIFGGHSSKLWMACLDCEEEKFGNYVDDRHTVCAQIIGMKRRHTFKSKEIEAFLEPWQQENPWKSKE